MKQAVLALNLSLKKTGKRKFLQHMEQVVPQATLVELISLHHPERRTGSPPFSLLTMLRIHFMLPWFTLSNPGMEGAFFNTPLYREFARLAKFARRPDEAAILRVLHHLEKLKLAPQILVTVNQRLTQRDLLLKAGIAGDAPLISAPNLTKNTDKARDPEMHRSQKGKHWHFGMKAHIGADVNSGLVHIVRGTSGYANDVTAGNNLRHGRDFGDAGYLGIEKRPDAKAKKVKAGVRAKVTHPFQVIKRQFGFVTVRYRKQCEYP